MNQCVPSWDVLDDPNPPAARLRLDIPSSGQQTTTLSPGPVVPMSDFEVAELTWVNGNISSQGLGAPRGIVKAVPKYNSAAVTGTTVTAAAAAAAAVPSATGITWAKQQLSGGGTLEEVVNEATRGHMLSPAALPATNFVPWTSAMHAAQAAVDLLVPCSREDIEPTTVVRKRARVVGEDGRVCASQGSTAPGRGESTLVTLDTCGGGAGAGEDMAFTTTTNNSTSLSPLDGEGGGSPETENASIGGGGANESICHRQRSKAII